MFHFVQHNSEILWERNANQCDSVSGRLNREKHLLVQERGAEGAYCDTMTELSLDPNSRLVIIDDVRQKLHDQYIFPEVAQQMG